MSGLLICHCDHLTIYKADGRSADRLFICSDFVVSRLPRRSVRLRSLSVEFRGVIYIGWPLNIFCISLYIHINLAPMFGT